MFEDIVEIMTFTLSQIKDNKVNGKACVEIYDTYKELHNLQKKAKLVISYLSREVNHEDMHTSHGTPTKKWIWFNNKQIREYENIKYALFCKLSDLDRQDGPYGGILSTNFTSLSLNCKIDDYTEINHIDADLMLYLYKFNLVKNNCPSMRHFDTLFTKAIVDVSSDNKRMSVINQAKESYEILDNLIIELEDLISRRCSIRDLFYI